MSKPLCFVLMPSGVKPAPAGGTVDFDAVYRKWLAPAIEAAGLEPLRADEEIDGGLIHRPLFERLLLCEYAVADLTTAKANVFYELGVRHATKPHTTVLLFAEGQGRPPFDVASLRALPYRLTPAGAPADPDAAREALAARLREARNSTPASPLLQLLDDYPEVAHRKTDVFRDQVRYAAEMKARLARARSEGVEAVRTVERDLGDVKDAEAGVVVDLFLSYRALKAWGDMIGLVPAMSPPLAATVLVREQLALALNRAGRGEEAETVLLKLIEERGPSSETYGLLGRVYKDRWEVAAGKGETSLAKGLLEKAVGAYLTGFEADWRDAYPGVNAVTLMELGEPPDPRRTELLPVVAYAVERRIAAGRPDYWDHATRLELAVLAKDEERARAALCDALAAVRESWEPETTARNLRLVRERRDARGERVAWAAAVEKELGERART